MQSYLAPTVPNGVFLYRHVGLSNGSLDGCGWCTPAIQKLHLVTLRLQDGYGSRRASKWIGFDRRGAIHEGADRGGAKDGDQGKCGPVKHVPGAEPGKRDTGARTHTETPVVALARSKLIRKPTKSL